ncbi:DUF2017 family protein [Pengzhenrongella frigida]|uniref:DUF2017 family protein n=1 Tax=Pengzhenrongella frigida TaxID=1259133 RepID=A0A4Q5N2H6_9MICO|nr:DUF2017 family protein [Cellulomonas sp. HLT2-17]RYV52340.1 DUF2017 family protein [Cellulomonas sp. HLT2-17]
MRAFRSEPAGYVAGLDATEREVLATVVADVAELLGADRFEATTAAARGADAPDESATRSLLGLRPLPAVVPAPVDPAVHRLLPDASDDDDELAAEFRRLTEGDLRRVKIDRLRVLWQALVGDAPDAPAVGHGAAPDDGEGTDLWVRREDAVDLAATLTDLRLVLADRLGVESEEDSDAIYEALDRRERGEQDPDRSAREVLQDEIREYLGSVFAALGWLQESLMAVLLEDLP